MEIFEVGRTRGRRRGSDGAVLTGARSMALVAELQGQCGAAQRYVGRRRSRRGIWTRQWRLGAKRQDGLTLQGCGRAPRTIDPSRFRACVKVWWSTLSPQYPAALPERRASRPSRPVGLANERQRSTSSRLIPALMTMAPNQDWNGDVLRRYRRYDSGRSQRASGEVRIPV